MENHRSRFINGCKKNNINEITAISIFDKMEKFAGYGFNKSHSVAYAMLSYQTAYLKAYYTSEFLAAAMSSDMDNTNKIINLLSACNEMDIIVLSPDINSSSYRFLPQRKIQSVMVYVQSRALAIMQQNTFVKLEIKLDHIKILKIFAQE